MSDILLDSTTHGFRDLIPWADPYIVEIVRRLQRSSEGRLDHAWPDTDLSAEAPARPSDVSAEAPPPLFEPDENVVPPRTRDGGRIGRYWS